MVRKRTLELAGKPRNADTHQARRVVGRKRNPGKSSTTMLRRLFEILRAVMLAQVAAVLAGCGTFVPPKVEDPAFERHAVTREKSNVTVTVAVLTARESMQFFGVPLESKAIQPVWLKVENRNDY